MQAQQSGKANHALLMPFLCCFLLFAFTCLFNSYRVDDAYITASYARTLGTSGTWGMHPGFPSDAATSPLNVIVLAIFVRLGIPAVTAQTVLNGLLIALTFYMLLRMSRMFFDSDLWAYAGTAALFLNPLLISTLGLESYLYLALLLTCCLGYFLRRVALTGFCCGLLILARPDGVLFVLVLVLFLLRDSRKELLRFFASLLPAVIAWEFYSWRFLGSAIPDTFFLKRGQAAWGPNDFGTGLRHYMRANRTDLLVMLASSLAFPLALYLMRVNRKWLAFGGLLCIPTLLHFVSYTALGVPPYHWYYAQECATFALLSAAGVVYAWKRFAAQRWMVAAAYLAVLAASAGTDIRSRVRFHSTPFTTNYASAPQFRDIALWVNDHSTVRSYKLDGELGVIQYYSRAEAVNDFSDREILLHPKETSSPLVRWLRQVNTRYLKKPEPPENALLTSCSAGDPSDKTWVTTSKWHPPQHWCWRDDTRGVSPSPAK